MIAAGRFLVTYGRDVQMITLWPTGDWHEWNKNQATARLERDLKLAADDPCALVLGMGDYAEMIDVLDLRFDAASFPDGITAKSLADMGVRQKEAVKARLLPLRRKIIGLLWGNHERRYHLTKRQENLHQALCDELKVPNFEYSARFELIFRRLPRITGAIRLQVAFGQYACWNLRKNDWLVRVFCHHGAGSAATEGGKINKIVQFLLRQDCDLALIGHVHDQIAKRIAILGTTESGEELVDEERVGAITGTYLRPYGAGEAGYAEVKGYSPTPIGAVPIRFYPQQNPPRFEAAV